MLSASVNFVKQDIKKKTLNYHDHYYYCTPRVVFYELFPPQTLLKKVIS